MLSFDVQMGWADSNPADGPADRSDSEVGDLIRFGVSPRGAIALTHAARAEAFLNDRDYVVPDDVRAVLWDVFRHRIVLSYEAIAEELTADDVIRQIADRVPVP